MTYQNARNIKVAFMAEPGAIGTPPAAGAGASGFRASPSSGLKLGKADIQPTEFRSDGLTTQSRDGTSKVEGQYDADLSMQTFNALFEAAWRNTFANTIAITQTDVTSITTTTNTIVGASGSFLTLGVRRGDIIRLTGHSTVANNNKNLRVVGVSASTITLPAGSLTADAVADTSFTITVQKRLVNGVALSRSFAFEEYNQDIDDSELFVGVRVTSVTLKFVPDATVMVTFKCIGLNETLPGSGASSPYFTPVTYTTTTPLVTTDGKLYFNGADAVDFTSFEVTVDLNGSIQPTLGSNQSPDVFVNPAKVTAKLSALRKDLTKVGLFVNETHFEVGILCEQPGVAPKEAMHFWLGNCKIAQGIDKNFGGDGALIENAPINVGADEAGGDRALTMVLVSSTL